MKIKYRFEHESLKTIEFAVDVDAPPSRRQGQGEWTRLASHQCTNCPLKPETSPFCPAAVDLEELVSTFNAVMSYERVHVVVETPHRNIERDCDAQTALSALMGLIMANSDCPILANLKGLARTHLPFQTMEELLSRLAGAGYLGQLLKQRKGETPDWSMAGLGALFDDLSTLNRAFKARIDSAARQDATMNAISAIAMQMLDVQYSLEDCAEELEQFAIGMD